MDEIQRQCLETLLKDHNLVIVGQGGTGKTHSLKKCVKQLPAYGKNVVLVCYTGNACLQYQGLKAITLQKFPGLEDGRHSSDEMLHMINTDEWFRETKSLIMTTDTLIIDEISMVGRKILESVEYICRHLKENKYFGDIQATYHISHSKTLLNSTNCFLKSTSALTGCISSIQIQQILSIYFELKYFPMSQKVMGIRLRGM